MMENNISSSQKNKYSLISRYANQVNDFTIKKYVSEGYRKDVFNTKALSSNTNINISKCLIFEVSLTQEPNIPLVSKLYSLF